MGYCQVIFNISYCQKYNSPMRNWGINIYLHPEVPLGKTKIQSKISNNACNDHLNIKWFKMTHMETYLLKEKTLWPQFLLWDWSQYGLQGSTLKRQAEQWGREEELGCRAINTWSRAMATSTRAGFWPKEQKKARCISQTLLGLVMHWPCCLITLMRWDNNCEECHSNQKLWYRCHRMNWVGSPSNSYSEALTPFPKSLSRDMSINKFNRAHIP